MDARYGGAGSDSYISNFLLKLVDLLENPAYQDHCSWEHNGKSFVIFDQANFAKSVLPKFFKHNKFSSFVRQLNMYGFRKVPVTTQGGIESLQESIQFHHPLFQRNKFEKLPLIKRKVAQNPRVANDEISQVTEMMQDIRQREAANNMSINELRTQNHELWQEVQKLQLEQLQSKKLLQNLVKYLVSLYQAPAPTAIKRRQLMIDDGLPPKIAKSSDGDVSNQPPGLTNIEIISDDDGNSAVNGPLITELLSSSQLQNSVGSPPPIYNIRSPENFDINSLLNNTSSIVDGTKLTSSPMRNPTTPTGTRMIKLALPPNNSIASSSRSLVGTSGINNKQLVLAPQTVSVESPKVDHDAMWLTNYTNLQASSSTADMVNDLQNKLADYNGELTANKSYSTNDLNNLMEGLPRDDEPSIEDPVEARKALMNYTNDNEGDTSGLSLLGDGDLDHNGYDEYFNENFSIQI